MYPPSNPSSDYHKGTTPIFSPSADAATGIPITSKGNYYGDNPHATREIHPTVPWSSGLFGCCSDRRNCCITFWCPCITFGQIAEIVDKGSTSCAASGALYSLICFVTGCTPCYSCFYRSKLRQQYMLKETPCNDCLLHCFCEQCALCQEYRELQNRGYDMSIGWHGNLERRNQGVMMNPVATTAAPAMGAGMSR